MGKGELSRKKENKSPSQGGGRNRTDWAVSGSVQGRVKSEIRVHY